MTAIERRALVCAVLSLWALGLMLYDLRRVWL